MSGLSHLDAGGRARMVDVSAKDQTERTATAKGAIFLQAATLDAIVAGELPKGDVFAVARVAGIMAAKRTSDVIPLCHPLPITGVMIELNPDKARSTVEISATVKVTGRTGVEMEALTAVSTAALTIYDMCKAIDRGMVIGEIRLVSKAGGRSGTFDAT